mgnify:CR=1 FL=1
MPHCRFQHSEAIGNLNRAANLFPNLSNVTDTDVSITSAEPWTNNITVQESPAKWVTALFVQFRFLHVDENSEHKKVLTQFRDLLEIVVSYHQGDVVALSRDAGLAIFSGSGKGYEYTQNAIEVATSLIEEANNTNRERLARI